MGSCESCDYAKATRKPIGNVCEPGHRDNVGDEVHSDLWGPSPVRTNAHSEYFVSFTDNHSRYTKIYLLKTKDERFDAYRQFKAWMGTQLHSKIKRLRSD